MTTDKQITLEMVPLSAIHPYAHNAKKHPNYQIEQIKASIQQFGNNDPIAIDENHVIIEGHGRYLALKALGYQEVPVIKLCHLSEDQKRAYILAHNQITLNTAFDVTILKEELTHILDIDMAPFGFSVNLLSSPLSDEELSDSEVPTEETVSVQVGDLYQCGEHRLMCGDSTNPDHLAKLLAGQPIDLYVTDPPYNVAYEGKTKAALTIPNDNLDDQAFQTFLVDAFHNVDQYLKAGGVFYIWHADKERLAFSTALQQVGWLEKQALIWVKDSFVLGRQDYQWQHEPCLYGWKAGASHYFVSDFSQSTILESQLETKSKQELIALIKTYQANQPTSILRVNRPTKNEDHPTMKPVALLERLIRSSSKRRDCVLDTFAGSGSTLLACERLGRKSYSMELEPKYVARILNRFQQETGQVPIKLNKEE